MNHRKNYNSKYNNVMSEMNTDWLAAYARPGQLLKTHSDNVSILASKFAEKCGIAQLLQLAGYFHDLGKITSDFQNYLFDVNPKREKVQHSILGAKRAYANTSDKPIIAEILCNIIAAHHGSLYDDIAPDGSTPLIDRIEKAVLLQSPEDCPNIETDKLFKCISIILSKLHDEDRAFGLSMLIKYAYSCLVDADRLDAYLAENNMEYNDSKSEWVTLLDKLNMWLIELSKNNTPPEISLFRQQVSDGCAKAGIKPRGIYKLEVPTGGGKTLSSLRFALVHANYHKMDRIIYVIPYLSIITQTANEIRKSLSADENIVLEHHSGFLPDKRELYKYHTDRWDSKIIITTQVQFLESVFSAKGSDLRKLHNMANSVIIFDEVQSIPVKCIHLFNGVVNFLHAVCGCTILLCTATQPLLDKVDRKIRFTDDNPIVQCGLLSKRTKIINAMTPGGYSYTELTEFILNRHTLSTLVIVNTKAAAKNLYSEIKKNGTHAIHLSTNMCAAHRENVFNNLRKYLCNKTPVICISTQLIEAGVDISFECVIRDIAGLDSVYQAAGRCNRNGEFNEIKNVYVINIKDEILDKLTEIKTGAEITRRLFDENKSDNINEYYEYYFFARKCDMDYKTETSSIYSLLTDNVQGHKNYQSPSNRETVKNPAIRAALRSAADAFYVIDRGRTDIIVPYGESMDLVSEYNKSSDIDIKRVLLRKMGKYSVSLYGYQFDALDKKNALNFKDELIVLSKGFYDEERGVDLEGQPDFLYL